MLRNLKYVLHFSFPPLITKREILENYKEKKTQALCWYKMLLLIEKEMSNAIKESKIHSNFKGPWEVSHSKVLLRAWTLNSGNLSHGFCPVKSWEKFPWLNYPSGDFFLPYIQPQLPLFFLQRTFFKQYSRFLFSSSTLDVYNDYVKS